MRLSKEKGREKKHIKNEGIVVVFVMDSKKNPLFNHSLLYWWQRNFLT